LVFRNYYLVRVFLEFPSHRLLVIDDRITHTIDGAKTTTEW
jgi:hypothetical protein